MIYLKRYFSWWDVHIEENKCLVIFNHSSGTPYPRLLIIVFHRFNQPKNHWDKSNQIEEHQGSIEKNNLGISNISKPFVCNGLRMKKDIFVFVLQLFIISVISLGAQIIVGYCQFWPQLSPEGLVQKTFLYLCVLVIFQAGQYFVACVKHNGGRGRVYVYDGRQIT